MSEGNSLFESNSEYPKSHQGTLQILRPRNDRQHYLPPFDRPPSITGRYEVEPQVKRFASWAGSVRRARNISPRFIAAVEHTDSKCKKWLKEETKSKKINLENDIEVGTQILEKYWDDLFGGQGLVPEIREFAKATDETRLYLEYGDVLGINLTKFRKIPDIPQCLRGPKTWQEVDKELREEENAKMNWTMYKPAGRIDQPSEPPSPIANTINEAATAAGRDPSQVRWEIVMYADRCGYAHSGITELVSRREWDQLAKKIHKDLKWLRRDWKESNWQSRGATDHMVEALRGLRDQYSEYVSETVEHDERGNTFTIVEWELLPKILEAQRKNVL